MITAVYICTNGNVMVFDEYEKQIPEYQGRIDRVFDKIMKDIPDSAIVKFLNYGTGEYLDAPILFSCWQEKE